MRWLVLAGAFVVVAAVSAWRSWPSLEREETVAAIAPGALAANVGGEVVASAATVAPAAAATPAPTRPAVAPASPAPTAPAADVARARDPNGDLTPDISAFVNKGEKPTMREVIDRLHQAGERGGLAAFSPPGTRPPLIGLAVPEDFPLPDGYVRHYQATDDGQRIEPILMFAPDRQFFDAANRPIAIPKDRVVPPELAPPGLPIRRIAIPAPIEPGR